MLLQKRKNQNRKIEINLNIFVFTFNSNNLIFQYEFYVVLQDSPENN